MESSSWVGSQKSMPGVLHGVARFLAVLGLRVSVVHKYVWLYGVLCDPTSVRRC